MICKICVPLDINTAQRKICGNPYNQCHPRSKLLSHFQIVIYFMPSFKIRLNLRCLHPCHQRSVKPKMSIFAAMQKIYNRTNFHKHTFCIYREVPLAEMDGLKLSYSSKSGSSYYFTEKGLYRVSNHWGRAANCRWRLLPLQQGSYSKTKVGYADWTDFYPNNEHEKLFYIEVDWTTNEVSFQHKANPNYDGKSQLRNASETAKVIRQINEVITTENWAKYLKFDSIIALRKEVINQLITTNQSFLDIKRKTGELYGTT